MAPSTMPLMICFWAMRKTIIMGSIARRAAVRIRSHDLTKEPTKAYTATGRVLFGLLCPSRMEGSR